MWLRLVYFLVFCAGWIIGFMAEFERVGDQFKRLQRFLLPRD